MQVNLLKNSAKIFLRKQTNILSASFVLMIAVLVSRLLGLIRDRLLAGTFFAQNQEWQLDVYFAAFRLPDMLFQLLVIGALSAAFIPIFSRYLDKDERGAWRLASSVITLAGGIFILLASLIFIFALPLNRLIAPTFNSEELHLMVRLTRIMLVAQFFFVISNFCTGILQSYQRFLLPALAPVAYNIGIILGILFLSGHLGIYGPTLGVALGALFHLLIQIPLLWRLGFVYKPAWDWKSEGIRKIAKLMLPRTLSLGVNQIELTIAVLIATSLATGSLSIFYLAQHLSVLPVGLFGLTIGQAALPALSKEATGSSLDNFRQIFLASWRQILYLALPAGVLLIVLRIPLVRIAFGAKTFPWEATLLTGKVVAILAVSVFAQSVIQLLVRGFYALQDTVTPLLISVGIVILNVLLSFWLVFGLKLGVLGLSLAITIATLFQALLLFLFLEKKIGGLPVKLYLWPFSKMLVASFATGIALWIPMRFLDKLFDTTRTIQLVILTILAGVSGLAVYLAFSKLLQIKEIDIFWKTLRRFGKWQRILAESEEVLDASVTPQATSVSEE